LEKLVVIDGNSILNRAFYGIMGSKMLMTADGTYTNAVYGFLAIMFKMMEEENPNYLVVAFDVKAPTKRHEIYKEYKGTRKGMPDELAAQMPIIKEVLKAMNITVLEKAGYEADDILGTLSRYGEQEGLEVKLLTGDRDSFQLATDKTTIMLPRTKAGKTETEFFDRNAILETYGVEPLQMIEVKGLMGDSSDNIPGVPGIGEKTALTLIKEYGSIENLYEKLEKDEATLVKGKTKEKLLENKDLAILSKTLGTINVDSPIEKDLQEFKVVEWNKKEIYELFKKLRFNRYIERFNLSADSENLNGTDDEDNKKEKANFEIKKIETEEEFAEYTKIIEDKKKMFCLSDIKSNANPDLVISKEIANFYIFVEEKNAVIVVSLEKFKTQLKELLENKDILKVSHDIKTDYILLKQVGIDVQNYMMDVKIAGYLLNSTSGAYKIEELASAYTNFDIDEYTSSVKGNENTQTSLFDVAEEKEEEFSFELAAKCYAVAKLEPVLEEKLKEINSYKLFTDIEMPTAEVLAEMQYTGVYVDEKEIYKFGSHLKADLEELRIDIYKQAGEEFNINSTQQLGRILFEKLNLPAGKKNKNGYATDVDTLTKLRDEHPIIAKILDYRKIMKLNSTYVEGLLPYIHEKTGRIHSYFHQTVTATGRLSSTDPNLQNIPTRTELGKKLRKVFKAQSGKIFIDADYSQIELRILAHMSKDENMVNAFNSDQDIHTICASQVFKVPVESVSKQLRSRAKAVNFGIVYGISDFGLAEQIDIKRKEAKEYIDQYLETYSGIDKFMKDIVEDAKQKGYVETEYGRRRYIPELSSKNYMIRKFGERAAMNTPIQGTAADIMKIAMIKVYRELKDRNLKSKIVLQIHDELLIETVQEEKDEIYEILKSSMENAAKLSIPLKVEVSEGKSWFQAK
jgi:DNA polymerase-1